MIGVLALQGDYEKHIHILGQLGMASTEVRYPKQLDNIEGLIIPGGESTTMTDLMQRVGFHDPIRTFASRSPILGTCAGLIMMAGSVEDSGLSSLGILDVDVDRNAYGRQVHSFTDDLPVSLNGQIQTIKATFIRAPKISRVGSSVEVISSYDGEPVAVKQSHHLGLAFHPELDSVTLFHEFIFKTQFETIHAA